MTRKIKEIVNYFAQLPGIGPRHATRIVLAMMTWPQEQVHLFANVLGSLKEELSLCNQCFNIAEADTCNICQNPKRNPQQILVVEQITDLIAVENSKVFQGVYHVLGGSISPNNTPDNLHIKKLKERVTELCKIMPTEVILATNPNTYGEATALYVQEVLRDLPISITRLARGLSSGSSVEYADSLTLANAFKDRNKLHPF